MDTFAPKHRSPAISGALRNGDLSSPSDRLAVRLAETVTRFRWTTILLAVLILAGTAYGGRHLEFSNNYRVFFSADNPDLLAFENFQATYTKNDNILFVIQPKEGQVFTPRLADAIETVTAAAWKIPYAIRVDSVSNFQHTWADGDELTVEDLIRDGASLPTNELVRKQAIALAEPLLKGNLISPDADTTGVNVTLQYPEKSLTEVPQAVAKARQIVAEIQAAHPDLTVALTGVSMLNNAFAESGQTDAMTLIPLMYGILIAFMILTLRSWTGTVSALFVVGASTATAMGIAGYMGVKLEPVTLTAPTIILTLAIADSIHILVSYRAALQDGLAKAEALVEAIQINFLAITITSATTIVGFLCLNFSDAPPFHVLGNTTAIGIAAAWMYSITFLPAAMSLLPAPKPNPDAGKRWIEVGLDKIAALVTQRQKTVLVVMGALSLFLVAMASRIDLNDEWVKYFDHRITFRGDAEFGMEHLTGIYLMEYSVPAESPGAISDPAYLERLEAFTEWLRAQPEVTHVYSYTDIIKRLNKNMHGDDDAYYALPDNRDLGAQYLLLYELSLPYGLDLNDRIPIDKSATRVTATLKEVSTVRVRDFIARSEAWFRDNAPAHMATRPTSATVMFSYISQRNIESMLTGNAVAVVAISLILILALRSLAFGVFSILPNALPILMTFGVWALTVGQLGMAAATVSATALGIVVDDTVHFLTKYLRARRDKGMAPPEAVRYAFRTVGLAIVTTTIILVVGFGVLALSTFKVNAEMGLLTALAIAIALIFDFLLLPAMLMLGHRSSATKKGTDHDTDELATPA